MWRDAALVAAKDLRIEARSRVATNQVAPFAVLVLILFAIALDPDRGVLARAAAGLFWVAVLFSALLAVQRSFAIEAHDGARDGLRLSGLDAAGRDLLDDLVREAVREGATVLIASHELDRVRPLADRMVAMAGGLIGQQSKKPEPVGVA